MRILYLLNCITFLLTACNNASSPAEVSKTAANTFVDTFKDDTIPAYEDFPVINSPLDEETQLKIFKMVLKDVKTKKLYDFSALGNDRLLSAYTNFQKTFNSYRDSTDERYTEFFKNLFYKMELHEQEISNPETPDIRTRLEIARIKSDINAGFADKKSLELQK